MKIDIRPSVLAVPFLKAGALLPVTLAALLLMSGSLLAAPKQDNAAQEQAGSRTPHAQLATLGLGPLHFTIHEPLTHLTQLIGAQADDVDVRLLNGAL